MLLLKLLLPGLLLTGPAPDPKCPDACTLQALRVQGAISVDGLLDEEDWQVAPIATNFLQYAPSEGDPASQRTEVRVLFGSTSVYISAILYDSEPDKVLRTLGRRDEFNRADWFVVAIDSYYDRKTAYNFAVNAAGVQADGIYSGFRRGGSQGGFDFDASWDAVWDAAVRTTSEGWVVEMRIPYSMLRFADVDVQKWGVNFKRIIPRLSELDEWVLVPRSERSSGEVAQYGILEGITGIKPRRNLQVAPYSVAGLNTEEAEEVGQLQSRGTYDVGGDIKVGLSSSMTLDATINPDFGQVEADPAELNLTAFESFFPERRPFFTEGVQIFQYDLDRGGALLYTRRIGAAAPIIGAAKLSGRSGGGLSFGVFGAATGQNFNPGRYYGVGRLQQQIGQISSVGGMMTVFQRSIDDHLQSVTGGLDWDFRFRDNKYKFDGQISTTHRRETGSDAPLERGFALTAGLDRQRSKWNFFSNLTIISDDYNPNDIGRLRRNNYTNFFVGFSHQIKDGGSFGPFQRGTVRLFTGNGFSYREGLNNGMGFFFFSDWVTHGFYEIGLGIRGDYLFGGYDVTETRGLDPSAGSREFNVDLSFTTDTRRSWQLEPEIEATFYNDGGSTYEIGVEAEWAVSSRINLSAELGSGREINTIEWASNEAFMPTENGWAISEESGVAPEDVEIYRPIENSASIAAVLAMREPYDEMGRHYVPVFGRRNTRAVDMTLRSAITLSPVLSVQFYGQLFVARGTYENFQLMQNRDIRLPVDAFPKQYDFAIRSFQTNMVLRWEYRPGSTVFLVWSQSRWDNQVHDVFDLTSPSPFNQRSEDQLLDTFDIFPANAFLLKVSYKFLR